MTTDLLLRRYQGCLVGIAAGDALGAPAEFLTRREIQLRFGVLREMVGGGWLFVAPGEHTDDTQMTVCVATSLVEQQRFDPQDIARRFLDWFASNPKDVGNTIRVALNLMRAGLPWNQAGAKAHERLLGHTAGNGALMRAAPIALAARRCSLDEIIRWTDEASMITHWDARGRWAAISLNLAITALLSGTEPAQLVPTIAPRIGEPEVRRAVERAVELDANDVRTTGYAVHTLQAAVWCLSRTSSFEDALVAAVNFGDDADTTGAVTGALAGAYYGIEGIPERWRATLKGAPPLAQLAEQLLRLSELLGNEGRGREEEAGR